MPVNLPRPGGCIADPATCSAGIRPWAAGYVSSPEAAGLGQWAVWLAAVEARAFRQRLPLLRLFSDDHTTGVTGLIAMVNAIRDRTHLRHGRIGVVIIPALEHLSPLRDGSEQVTDSLLRLHFGVGIQAAIKYQHSPPERRMLSFTSGTAYWSRTQGEAFERLLFGSPAAPRRPHFRPVLDRLPAPRPWGGQAP